MLFSAAAVTPLSGVMSGYNRLDVSGSPYLVTDEVIIPYGSFLFIDAGVELRFSPATRLTCSGSIYSAGTLQDSVVFHSDIQSEPWAGILLNGVQKSNFEYTVFSGTVGYDTQPQYQAGLCALNTSLNLLNCSFYGNLNCVRVITGDVTIRQCNFSGGNSGELFIMSDGTGALIEDSDFGNLIDPPHDGYDAVEFVNCIEGDYTVRRCHIWNIYGDGIDCNGANITISDNIIHDIYDKGISLGTCAGGMGVPFTAELSGNIIYSCATGIAVKDGVTALVDRATVALCETGMKLYEKTAGHGGGNAAVTNSVIYANSTTAELDLLSSLSIDYSLAGDNEPWPGTGNILSDPFFLDQSSANFHLAFDSPCIDSGSPDSTDPDGTRADMGALFFPQLFSKLFINELQASNIETIYDEWGEAGDWLELYNGARWSIDLSSVYLSDDPDEPGKWRFPSGTVISSDEFLLVWLDNEPWKQGLHVPWSLSASGDSVYLSTAVAGIRSPELLLIDSAVFDNMQPDSSLGRFPDGNSHWRTFSLPTPGYTNTGTGSNPGTLIASYPCPNPCNSSFLTLDLEIDEGWTSVSVFDFTGRLVHTIEDKYLSAGVHRFFWDMNNADGVRSPEGVYLILSRHSGAIPVTRKIVVLSPQ